MKVKGNVGFEVRGVQEESTLSFSSLTPHSQPAGKLEIFPACCGPEWTRLHRSGRLNGNFLSVTLRYTHTHNGNLLLKVALKGSYH